MNGVPCSSWSQARRDRLGPPSVHNSSKGTKDQAWRQGARVAGTGKETLTPSTYQFCPACQEPRFQKLAASWDTLPAPRWSCLPRGSRAGSRYQLARWLCAGHGSAGKFLEWKTQTENMGIDTITLAIQDLALSLTGSPACHPDSSLAGL